ncbi:MAG: hypothetical protein ACLTQI_06060 [Slackia sp.]
MDQVAADGRIGFEHLKDADGAFEENDAAENDAMRFGSLGALVPDAVYDRYWSWGSDEGPDGFDTSDPDFEGCAVSAEPLPTADEALELFFDWVADRGIEPWPHRERSPHESHGGRSRYPGDAYRVGQIAGGARPAFHGAVHRQGVVLYGAHQGPGQREILLPR